MVVYACVILHVCSGNNAALQAWLDSRHVAVGTKCNKLLRVDTETMAVLEVRTALASWTHHMPSSLQTTSTLTAR